jgi:uncharacterized protein YgbK (DUF1537 family)
VAAIRDGAPGIVVQTDDQINQPAHELVDSLGAALAAVARAVIDNTNVRRVLIAGGDTSGHIVRNLGVTALELLPGPNDRAPGTALCRAISPDPTINGLDVLLKGGQIGTPDLFETFRTT